MKLTHFISVSAMIVACASQRSPYAGRRPIGFPEIETTTSASTQMDALGNRVGEATTTQRLPIEALGDKNLVNRLGQLPQDNQPFWFLNWQALEANRNKPQSYPQRPNVFVDQNFFFPALVSRSNTESQSVSQNSTPNNVSQSTESQSVSQNSTPNNLSQSTESQSVSQNSTPNNVSQSTESQTTTTPSTVTVVRS